jgi:hypothetical protein
LVAVLALTGFCALCGVWFLAKKLFVVETFFTVRYELRPKNQSGFEHVTHVYIIHILVYVYKTEINLRNLPHVCSVTWSACLYVLLL